MNARMPAAAMVILLLAGAAAPAGAQTGPFVVFLTCEGRDFGPGEVVNFSVHTFARGEAAIPDGPPQVVVGSGPGAGRALPVCATAPGEWSGSYTVLAADAELYGGISLQARAYFSGSGGGDYPYTGYCGINLADPPVPPATNGLFVRSFVLECPDGAIRPQSRIKFQVCATYDGAPVPAGDIRFWMTYRSHAGAEERTDLPAEERGPGALVVPYTVPMKSQSGYFQLHAESHGITRDFLSYINLDFFNVIYHELGRDGSAIEYEILVSDRSGNPVNGSTVMVWLTAYYTGIRTVALDLGKTDQNGKARGVADLGPGVGEFNIRGWANTSKCSQLFSGEIQVSDAYRPGYNSWDQFYIERLSPTGYLPSGGDRTLSYRAYFEGAPLRRQELDCYVRTYRGTGQASVPEAVSGRRVATDDNGTFTVNVTFPDSASSFAYVTAVGPGPPYAAGYDPSSDTVNVKAAPAAPPLEWANATFSTARAGQALKICASAPAGGLVGAAANWDFSYNESSIDRPWLVLNTFTWYLPARPSGQSTLRGQLVLPRHLKSGQNLTVTVTFSNASGQATSADFPLKVRPAAVEEPPADVCCITSIFVVNALLIVLLFFNYLAGRRGERRRGLGELDADGQIGAILSSSRRSPRDLSLPIKVELVQSEECTACGRKMARGNLAWRCVCGARYHEHCTGDGTKCPSCGRGWSKR